MVVGYNKILNSITLKESFEDTNEYGLYMKLDMIQFLDLYKAMQSNYDNCFVYDDKIVYECKENNDLVLKKFKEIFIEEVPCGQSFFKEEAPQYAAKIYKIKDRNGNNCIKLASLGGLKKDYTHTVRLTPKLRDLFIEACKQSNSFLKYYTYEINSKYDKDTYNDWAALMEVLYNRGWKNNG